MTLLVKKTEADGQWPASRTAAAASARHSSAMVACAACAKSTLVRERRVRQSVVHAEGDKKKEYARAMGGLELEHGGSDGCKRAAGLWVHKKLGLRKCGPSARNKHSLHDGLTGSRSMAGATAWRPRWS